MSRRCHLLGSLLSAVVVLCLTPGLIPGLPRVQAEPPAAPLSDRYPSARFNGLQFIYHISGVELGSPSDTPGFTTSRQYTGRLTSNVVSISGTALANSGWGADASVVLNAEGAKQVSWKASKHPEHGLGPDPMSERFSLSIEVPPEATWVEISLLLSGTYNAGGRGLLIQGTFTRPRPTPTVTATPATPWLEARADKTFLPADGVASTEIVFTYREGDEAVSGEQVDVTLDPAIGTLDLASAQTDANGEARIRLTAPSLAKLEQKRVTVRGSASGASAEVEITLGAIEIVDLGVYSRGDEGGETLYLEARVKSYCADTLRAIPVIFYEGDPDAGGTYLGEHNIENIVTGESRWSLPRPRNTLDLVSWEIGGHADKELYVQVPVTGWTDEEQPKRKFTVKNTGVPFQLNADAYSFVNPGIDAGLAAWYEDILALYLSNENISQGTQILSLAKLLPEVLSVDFNPGGGHCLGMANTANSYFQRPYAAPAPGDTYDMIWDDPAVRGNIMLAQMAQFSSRYKARLPQGDVFSAAPEHLGQFLSTVENELANGNPVTFAMEDVSSADPGQHGRHAVMAYQAVTIDELGVTRLMLYDSNYPWPQLADGLAPVASVTEASFNYTRDSAYTRVTLDRTPLIDPTAGAKLVEMAKELAHAQAMALLGVTPAKRLIVYRGDALLCHVVTQDGKRLGWGFENGKATKWDEIPGAERYYVGDARIFLIPGNIPVQANIQANEDGTITLGVATPKGGTSALPTWPFAYGGGQLQGGNYAMASFPSSPISAPAQEDPNALLEVVTFSQVPVSEGDTITLDATTSQITLSDGGAAIEPTGIETFAPADLLQNAQATSGPDGPPEPPSWQHPLEVAPDYPDSNWTDLDGVVHRDHQSLIWGPATWGSVDTGTGVVFGQVDSYTTIEDVALNRAEGTILVQWRPMPDMAATYAAIPAPPFGFLISTVGFNLAYEGAFHLAILPDDPVKEISFGVFHQEGWHEAVWVAPEGWAWDPDHLYDLAIRWGAEGMAIMLDGEVVGTSPDVVELDAGDRFFIGHGPPIEPQTPHSMVGCYQGIYVYDHPLVEYAKVDEPSTQPGIVPTVQPAESIWLGGEPWSGPYGGERPEGVPDDDQPWTPPDPATVAQAPTASAGSETAPSDGDGNVPFAPSDGIGPPSPDGALEEIEGVLDETLADVLPFELLERMRGRLVYFVTGSCCALPLLLLVAIILLISRASRKRRRRDQTAAAAGPATAVPDSAAPVVSGRSAAPRPIAPVRQAPPSSAERATPPEPIQPHQPVAPLEPVAPVAPVEPEPIAPLEPVTPVEPLEPVTPVEPEPVAPVEPEPEPIAPLEPVTPVEPVEPVMPEEPEPEPEPPTPGRQRFCEQCGAKLYPGSKFCGECGTPVRRRQ